MNRHKTTTIFSLPLSSSNLPTARGGCRSSCNKRHARAINSFNTNQTNQSLLQTITILPTNNRPCRRLEISPQLAREASKLMLLWRRLATPDTDTISEPLYQYPDNPFHIFPPPSPLRRKVSFLSSPLSLQRDALS
jgi:hypothetical protein